MQDKQHRSKILPPRINPTTYTRILTPVYVVEAARSAGEDHTAWFQPAVAPHECVNLCPKARPETRAWIEHIEHADTQFIRYKITKDFQRI